MTKSSLFTAYETLKAVVNPTDAQIEALAEFGTEVAKIEIQKQAAQEAYNQAHDAVIAVMGSEPMTVAEIYANCSGLLPEGFSKAKVQYGLLNYWRNEVVKVENPKGANGYCLA